MFAKRIAGISAPRLAVKAAAPILMAALACVGCGAAVQPALGGDEQSRAQAQATAGGETSQAAAGGEASQAQDAEAGKVKVVTTNFPPYDFAREISGGKAELAMLLPPGAESHSFEPSTRDIITIQECDLFIYAGGDSDEWVRGILASMDMSGKRVISMMDCVSVVEEEIVQGMEDVEENDNEGASGGNGAGAGEEDGESRGGGASDGGSRGDGIGTGDVDGNSRSAQDATGDGSSAQDAAGGDAEGEEEPELDEHVWTSPLNAKLIAQKISDTLCELDAENAPEYRRNTGAYMEKLDGLDGLFSSVVSGAARRTVVFADRFPFRYFADAYGLKYYAAFPGCATETEASAATVAFLIDKVAAERIPVVFFIEFSNEKMADTICEDTGAKKLLLHACHNISKADFDGGVTYLSIMEQNAANLKEALA
jgi:zinc transport system substrate-binding protein